MELHGQQLKVLSGKIKTYTNDTSQIDSDRFKFKR